MTRRLSIAGVLGFLISAGCATLSPPVRVEGQPADLEALVGKWSGEYVGDGARGRSGTIAFTLAAGENHAHGDVLMIPRGSTRPYERYDGREPIGPRREPRPPAEMLTIHFVRAENGEVYGTLAPYWDPDRDCQAWTSFRGRIKGSVIEGTFASTYARPTAETTGRWRVTRDR
jgi:hypothetical protein